MSDSDARDRSRPVIVGAPGRITSLLPLTARDNQRVQFLGQARAAARIQGQFERASESLKNQVVLSDSLEVADPQLVLVLEGIEEHADLTAAARELGLELLIEYEDAVDPDDEVALVSARPSDPMVRTCLHAICVDQVAMDRILIAWRAWSRSGDAGRNLGGLGQLFKQLRDVHPWGAADRLRAIDWDEYFEGRIPGIFHMVEVELWYRQAGEVRQQAIEEVADLVSQEGGRVLATVDMPEIGYLALKCAVTDVSLRRLANGDLDGLKVVKSSHVLYLKVEGQGLLDDVPDQEANPFEAALPTGPARVVILDGVPASNHPRLTGRVDVRDSDDLASATEATAELRRHGTWMTSAVIWGDIAADDSPLEGPVVVRPVLAPASDSIDNVEEFPASELVPDVMRRVFRELFEGDDDGLTVVNMSLGDPTVPFDTLMSAWARALDYLSWQYGVLVVVSAGNHPRLALRDHNSSELQALSGAERSRAIYKAQVQSWPSRRILSPAESINALTVGAVHDDASNNAPFGYVFDPHDGLTAVSPVSAFGNGHRRAIKPELAAPGGRVMFDSPPIAGDSIVASRANMFGVRVATPSGGEGQISGTSPATALVSRQLARLVDLADDLTDGTLDRQHRSVAAKTLLVHGARHPDWDFDGTFPIESAVGYGLIARDLTEGCAQHEATLLFIGDLGDRQQQDLEVPLPNGLAARDIKRVTATVAWLSPVNWRHRQYRRANLKLAKPTGFSDLPRSLDVQDGLASRGSSTVKHQVWEIDRAVASGYGDSLTAHVKCYGQAGGLGGRTVPYAVALTLWVAPESGIDVYTQVAQQVRPRVSIAERR